MKNIKDFDSISDYKRYTKDLVAENIDLVFHLLKPVVEHNLELNNNWILHKGRHNDTQKLFNQNLVNKDKIDQERNKIRRSLLELIDRLSESDFQNMLIEVQLKEELNKIQLKLKTYESKVQRLKEGNTKIQNEKERIQNELNKQRKINDDKIKALYNENEKLKGLAQNYEQTKKQVQANVELIEKLKNENNTLYRRNKKLSIYEKTLNENHQIINKLKKEKEIYLKEIKLIREQEKTLNINKQVIDNLKYENSNLKNENKTLRKEILNYSNQSLLRKASANKNIFYPLSTLILLLLLFSIFQFFSNQNLDGKLSLLNEQILDYQHSEADNEINNKVINKEADRAALSIIPQSLSRKSESKKNNDFKDTKQEKNNLPLSPKLFVKGKINIGEESRIVRYYKVRPDENTKKIIEKFGMSEKEFRNINPKIRDLNNIDAGALIRVLDIVTYKEYFVKPKDNFGKIVKKFKMWSYELKEMNDISNPDILKIDQRLIVFISKYYK